MLSRWNKRRSPEFFNLINPKSAAASGRSLQASIGCARELPHWTWVLITSTIGPKQFSRRKRPVWKAIKRRRNTRQTSSPCGKRPPG